MVCWPSVFLLISASEGRKVVCEKYDGISRHGLELGGVSGHFPAGNLGAPCGFLTGTPGDPLDYVCC